MPTRSTGSIFRLSPMSRRQRRRSLRSRPEHIQSLFRSTQAATFFTPQMSRLFSISISASVRTVSVRKSSPKRTRVQNTAATGIAVDAAGTSGYIIYGTTVTPPQSEGVIERFVRSGNTWSFGRTLIEEYATVRNRIARLPARDAVYGRLAQQQRRPRRSNALRSHSRSRNPRAWRSLRAVRPSRRSTRTAAVKSRPSRPRGSTVQQRPSMGFTYRPHTRRSTVTLAVP